MMKTQAIEKFDVLDTEALSTVEGGRKWGNCEIAVAGGAVLGGAITGGNPLGAIGGAMMAAAEYC